MSGHLGAGARTASADQQRQRDCGDGQRRPPPPDSHRNPHSPASRLLRDLSHHLAGYDGGVGSRGVLGEVPPGAGKFLIKASSEDPGIPVDVVLTSAETEWGRQKSLGSLAGPPGRCPVISYAPPWLFAGLTAAALLGFMTCGLSLVLRPVLTGVVCGQGDGARESGPLALFLAVAVVANTFWVVGA